MKLPDENTVAKALTYIAETDSLHAMAVAEVERLKKDEKVIYAAKYLEVKRQYSGKEKVTEKFIESHIHDSETYKKWLDDFEDATAVSVMLYDKRKRAFTVIDVWRSLNSSKNKGNIV